MLFKKIALVVALTLTPFVLSQPVYAAPAKKAKTVVVKKEEKKEAPVAYKKPTRKKVVKK